MYNLERFELTADTTYSEYKFAVTSKRVRLVPVPSMNLLPPEYPFMEITFCFRYPLYKLHHECPGRGLWHGQFSNMFSTTSDAINTLVNDKDRFWCRFCGRPLFSSFLSRPPLNIIQVHYSYEHSPPSILLFSERTWFIISLKGRVKSSQPCVGRFPLTASPLSHSCSPDP
jgi:hypothetical protein